MRMMLMCSLLALAACGQPEAPAEDLVEDPVDEPVAEDAAEEAAPEEAPGDIVEDVVEDVVEDAAEEAAPEEAATPEDAAPADAGEAAPAEEAAAATPADIVYEHPMGKVTFSHTTHAPRTAGCGDCHPAPFAMKAKAASPMKMEDMYAGGTCGKCHQEGGAAFDSKECQQCHMK